MIKTRHIFRHLLPLLMAAATFVACSDEQDGELTFEEGQALRFTVEEQPFSTACDTLQRDSLAADWGTRSTLQQPVTRALMSSTGYATWETGDAIGVFSVNTSGTIVQSNIKMTYNSSTGQWTPTSAITYQSGYTYYAYYPYQATLPATIATTGHSKQTATTFFSPVIDAWPIPTDQSTIAKFNQADLMVAKATASSTGTVSFSMGHCMALTKYIVNQANRSSICYTCTNSTYIFWDYGPTQSVTNYTDKTCLWVPPSLINGTSPNYLEPLVASFFETDDNWAYAIVRPCTSTWVEIDENGKDDPDIRGDEIDSWYNQSFAAGEVNIYNVALNSYTPQYKTYTIEIGDVMHWDGSLAKTQDPNKLSVGVVAYIGSDLCGTSPYKHGLVMSKTQIKMNGNGNDLYLPPIRIYDIYPNGMRSFDFSSGYWYFYDDDTDYECDYRTNLSGESSIQKGPYCDRTYIFNRSCSGVSSCSETDGYGNCLPFMNVQYTYWDFDDGIPLNNLYYQMRNTPYLFGRAPNSSSGWFLPTHVQLRTMIKNLGMDNSGTQHISKCTGYRRVWDDENYMCSDFYCMTQVEYYTYYGYALTDDYAYGKSEYETYCNYYSVRLTTNNEGSYNTPESWWTPSREDFSTYPNTSLYYHLNDNPWVIACLAF